MKPVRFQFATLVSLALVFTALTLAPQPVRAQAAPGITFNTIYSFSAGPYGGGPQGGLTLGPDDGMYGATIVGGLWNLGVIFDLSSDRSLDPLASFGIDSSSTAGSSGNGALPECGVTLGPDGRLYGTTAEGGAYGQGTVFVAATDGTLTSLHAFGPYNTGTQTNADGADPVASVTFDSLGNLYGVASSGGPFGSGTIFEITPSGQFSVLYSFSVLNPSIPPANSDGAHPDSTLLLGDDGNFYGTTALGGQSGHGTVFKVTPTGLLTTLFAFDGYNGSAPSSLTTGGDGDFYGTTGGGGNAYGTIYEIAPNGTYTPLYSFSAAPDLTNSDGALPEAPLLLGHDGNFYGTTSAGGLSGTGTVFEVTPAGALTTLFEFGPNYGDTASNADGANPEGSLTLGIDGNLYGTTPQGGPYGAGTIFQITGTTAGQARASTTSIVAPSANPAAVGSTITFTATVTGSSPTGTVTFAVDGVPQAPVALAGGSAAFTTSTLSTGTHSIVGGYSGDSANAPSYSDPLTETIIGVPTANSQNVATTENIAHAIALSGTDPDSPPLPLAYTITSEPENGELSGTAPNLTYTPNAGYIGSDSFQFTVSNGYATSSAATVSIAVNPPPPAATPTFTPGTGGYENSVTVSIADTSPNPTIYYTTDGSTPSPGQGTTQQYTSPLTLSTTTTVNAVATAPNFSTSAVSSANYTVTYARIVQPQSASGTPGGTVVVPVTIVSDGSENTVDGTLTFDPSVLTYDSAAPGSDATGASLVLSTSDTATGSLGFSLALPSETTLTAGTRQIVTVTFTVAAGTTAFSTPIGWTGAPVPDEVTDADSNNLSATFTGAAVLTGVHYEGDLLGHGQVDLADWVEVGRITIGIDPQPTGLEYQEADCSPRETLGSGLAIGLADWVQVGRYVIGLDPLTLVGGPAAPNANQSDLRQLDRSAKTHSNGGG